MTVQAAPREISGVTYQDPIEFLIAGGFNREQARAVINAYKAYYSKGKPGTHWLEYVTANTPVKDEALATAIMRRYREFYGK